MMNTDLIKQQLLDKRASLGQRVSAIKADLAQGRPADFEEQASATENDDVLRSLQVEAEFEISQINRALNRIERGEYGSCEQCGADIGSERLEALPEATHCTSCA